MNFKNILCLLFTLPLFWGCTEDDIDEIFISGTWNVVNYFTKADWDKRNGEPVYKQDNKDDVESLKVISTFTLIFHENGTLEGTMQNARFDGTWDANGKERTVHMSIQGNPDTASRFNKQFIDALKEATYYQGDSNVLMLGPSDKRSYIQFRHNK
ncbi:MAG: DUF4847 domain-containing protein [Bacteroides sp.]|nr:DUF4847 domain-containing protein [Bacteroides sp.]